MVFLTRSRDVFHTKFDIYVFIKTANKEKSQILKVKYFAYKSMWYFDFFRQQKQSIWYKAGKDIYLKQSKFNSYF
jgi:hypothetical protein